MKTLLLLSIIASCFVSVARSDVQKALDAQKRGDHETARKEFQLLADKGDDKAMIELGLMYHTAVGVKQDYAKAMDWYVKAYSKANGDALNNIGVMYRDGLGVATNSKIAYLLFLAVHMEGLGTEATQMRAGRNLSRLAQSIPRKDLEEALSYTWEYVDQIVKSRGKNTAIGKDVLPAKARPSIKDNGWWTDEERKEMDFKSPPPWNVAGGEVPAAQSAKSERSKPAYVAVAISNSTGSQIDDAKVYFGEYRCSAGILGPGGTGTYIGWERPITTNAIVRWKAAKQVQHERSVNLSGIYEPKFDGELTFKIGATNVTATFKRIDRK